jgi:hypothetical protein
MTQLERMSFIEFLMNEKKAEQEYINEAKRSRGS